MSLVKIKDLYRQIAYLTTKAANLGVNWNPQLIKIEKKIEKLKAEYVSRQNKQYSKE